MSGTSKKPTWHYAGSGSWRIPTPAERARDQAASDAAHRNQLQPLHARRGNRPPPHAPLPQRASTIKPAANKKAAANQASEAGEQPAGTGAEVDPGNLTDRGEGSSEDHYTVVGPPAKKQRFQQAMITLSSDDEIYNDGNSVKVTEKTTAARPDPSFSRLSTSRSSKRVSFQLPGDGTMPDNGSDDDNTNTMTDIGQEDPSQTAQQIREHILRSNGHEVPHPSAIPTRNARPQLRSSYFYRGGGRYEKQNVRQKRKVDDEREVTAQSDDDLSYLDNDEFSIDYIRAPTTATITGTLALDLNDPDLQRAREILGLLLEKSPVMQYAVARLAEHSREQDRQRLTALRHALTPKNMYEWPKFKASVERHFSTRGIQLDEVFDVPGQDDVESSDAEDTQMEDAETEGAVPAVPEEGIVEDDSGEVDMTLARHVFRKYFDTPVLQQALSLEPALASGEDKLWIMKRSLQPSNLEDWAAFKARVEDQFGRRQLEQDAAFTPTTRGYTDENWYVPTLDPNFRTGLPPLTIADGEGENVTFEQIDAGAMPIARKVLRKSIMEPVIQYAIHKEYRLAAHEQKMRLMIDALTPDNSNDWPVFKAEVEKAYQAWGFRGDDAFGGIDKDDIEESAEE